MIFEQKLWNVYCIGMLWFPAVIVSGEYNYSQVIMQWRTHLLPAVIYSTAYCKRQVELLSCIIQLCAITAVMVSCDSPTVHIIHWWVVTHSCKMWPTVLPFHALSCYPSGACYAESGLPSVTLFPTVQYHGRPATRVRTKMPVLIFAKMEFCTNIEK